MKTIIIAVTFFFAFGFIQTNEKLFYVEKNDIIKFYIKLPNKKFKEIYKHDNTSKTNEVDTRIIKTSKIKIQDITIYEAAVGTSQSILFNFKNQHAYITERYDLRALGDSLIYSSLDISKGTIPVLDMDTKTMYFIKIKKLY